MKNNFSNYIYTFFFIFCFNCAFAQELQFESKSIEFENENRVLIANEGVEILGKNIKITADQSKYFKEKDFLQLKGNVQINDYLKDLIIKSEEIDYDISKEILFSNGNTNIYYKKKYEINSSDLEYNRIEQKILSTKESIFFDDQHNKIVSKGFKIDIGDNKFISNSAKFFDKEKNEFISENLIFDFSQNKIASKDIQIFFADEELGKNARIKGNALISENNLTKIKKGIFTTCEEREDNCPPWSISASEIVHDKKNKTINYLDTWVNLYDVPVFYFPKFFHPDPSVKRQSGFLVPSMLTSSTNGDSVTIPYYHVISENKDFTMTPRIYFNNTIMLQNEYRQVEKNTDFITDFSIKKLDNTSKSHLFANAKHKLENFDGDANLEINLEKTTNDTYLRSNNIKSATNSINQSLLHSYIKFENYNENTGIYLDANIYEDLTKEKNSDKFQYVLPSFKVSNLIGNNFDFNGKLNLINSGSITQNETNKTTNKLINDIVYKSNSYYSNLGTVSNYNLHFKNTNKEIKSNNSSEFTLDNYGLLSFETSLPLQKKTSKFTSNLSPKILLMYSPSKTENIINKEKRINSTNIFFNNRLGLSDSLEGGQSITIGTDYEILYLNNNKIKTSLGQIFRDVEDKRLPTKSKMRNKSSDLVGNFGLNLNEMFDINYNFSADNNFESMNYNKLETEISINNFITKFEFLEENNEIGNESYMLTNLQVPLKKNRKLYYKTRRNRKTDLTEFYNLVYEYKNDCLVAAIEYNKNYYTDRDLKPSENIFFTLTFTPFTSVDSPNLINE